MVLSPAVPGPITDTIKWPPHVTVDGATLRHDPMQTVVPPRLDMAPTLPGLDTPGVPDALAKDGPPERLVLEGPLGEGGMAVVHLGTQTRLGRKVAVKSLHPMNQQMPTAVMELLQEAWITGTLEHPNVVPIHDVELDGHGNPLVILKRIDGVPWRELVNDAATVRERFGATDLLEWNLGILMQVLNAVRYAHSRRIIHRDLKPDNVMIGEFGEVYLMDWGIALSLADDGTGRLPLASKATELAGTLCYLAPEMIPDMGIPLSERTDVYLAGAILYELLTGKPPHDCSSLTSLVTSVTRADPPLPASTPPRLAAICRRAMDPDPDGRFESVEQLRLAIQGHLRHHGAMRILAQAEARLRELDDALHGEGRPARPGLDDLAHRQRIYKLYGECRFGFREARTSGLDNDQAEQGLERATRLMIEHELASGETRAAAALLADLPAPPRDIEERISRALAAEEAEKERLARLERLGRAMDMSAGHKTRRALILILGMAWVVTPLLHQWLPGGGLRRTHAGVALGTAAFLGLGIVITILARRMLAHSLVNRRYFAALLFVYVTQAVLQLGLWLADLPLPTFQLFVLLCNFITLSMMTIAVDVRLWPTALAFGAAFLFAAAWLELRFYGQSGACLVLMINALTIWKPARPQAPDPAAE